MNDELVLSASVTLPAGTDAYVFPYLVHRAPGNFQNPDTFDPHRWLGSADDRDPAFTSYYLPFSAGPRNCVGARVAQAEMKAIVAQLVTSLRR